MYIYIIHMQKEIVSTNKTKENWREVEENWRVIFHCFICGSIFLSKSFQNIVYIAVILMYFAY